ncbi:MAG: glycoside hydrolase family 27 protein [Clostridia bacterium]|nr:glycoside hydrolase family 27 protein [Clostridia bacterium]
MLVQSPPMGWNSWNTFGPDVCEAAVKEAADLLVSLGLKDAGYEYVVIDDCWALRRRNEDGRLVADPDKFPSGMKALADYVHSKGLKFGIYSCVGVLTCAGYPGSYEHEFEDAETFASWGVDFLKYDYCFKPSAFDGAQLYNRMAMALRATGRDILFSACSWGHQDTVKWARAVGAHMFRSDTDVHDFYTKIRTVSINQIPNICYSAPNCYNDMDMLVCGMKNNGFVAKGGCTDEEYRLQFALWALCGSPLFIGSDLSKLDGDTLSLLTNKHLLAINQDKEARPPFRFSQWRDTDERLAEEELFLLWKHLDNGEYAMGFFNFSDVRRGCFAKFTDFGLPATAPFGVSLFDIFEEKELGVFKDYYSMELEPHSCAVFRARLVRDE